ncbi:hypothetical protein BH09PSE1_BH09PSE1_08160 [soil metagenome]
MPKFVQFPRILIVPLTIATATLVLATPSLAQQVRPGEQMGMRYLSWAGKPAEAAPDDLRRPGDVTPRQQANSQRVAPAPTLVGRPSRYGSPTANGLTPASAWTSAPTAMPAPRNARPAPVIAAAASESSQSPIPAPTPLRAAASAPEYDAGRSFRRQDPYFSAPPQVQMAMQPTPQPTYMPPPVRVPNATEAAPPAGYDPMAPRPDAPIFRMGRPAEQAAPDQTANDPQAAQVDQNAPHRLAQAPTQAGDPPREGARYYSVHREAGREPDPLTLPESVFIGGGATQDLAEPPPTPVTTRTVNGRAQVIVPNQDPTLP